MLSTAADKGLGLALLRLEHVEGVINGRLKFELHGKVEKEEAEVRENDKWSVVPWYPDWWPQKPPEASGTSEAE